MTNLAPKLVSLDETFSVASLQQRFWTRMTGAEMAAHNNTAEPLNILCIESGSGFIKGHVYVIDDEGIIHDVFAPHTHSDASSGTLYEIKRANYRDLIEMDCSLNIFKELFHFTKSSTGTVATDVDTLANTKYVITTTATASDDYCNLEAGGGRLFFGEPITLQLKYAVSDNTFINYRMGCGQPLIQNAVGTGVQMGFEGCTGTNTSNRVFSSDGTTWSAEDMSNMVPTGAIPLGLRIDFYPSSKIVATDGEGTEIIKTGNLPTIGSATNADATFRAGCKTLTTAARWLKIYSMRLLGDSYDSTAGLKGWL